MKTVTVCVIADELYPVYSISDVPYAVKVEMSEKLLMRFNKIMKESNKIQQEIHKLVQEAEKIKYDR